MWIGGNEHDWSIWALQFIITIIMDYIFNALKGQK